MYVSGCHINARKWKNAINVFCEIMYRNANMREMHLKDGNVVLRILAERSLWKDTHFIFGSKNLYVPNLIALSIARCI